MEIYHYAMITNYDFLRKGAFLNLDAFKENFVPMKKLLSLIILVVIGLFAWQIFFSGSNYREGKTEATVCQIVDNPRKYAEFKQVTVEGKVVGSKSLAGYNLFEVKQKEKDCSIDVVSEGASPSEGETLTVKGQVQEAFKLGDNRMLVIVEK